MKRAERRTENGAWRAESQKKTQGVKSGERTASAESRRQAEGAESGELRAGMAAASANDLAHISTSVAEGARRLADRVRGTGF